MRHGDSAPAGDFAIVQEKSAGLISSSIQPQYRTGRCIMTPSSRHHSADFEDETPSSLGDVLEDLRAVVRDAESLLRETGDHVGDRVADVRTRIEEKLEDARERLQQEGTAERMKSAARSTETYVRENPWTAVLIAAGLGYLIGNLGRRR
jgi:ElaB/YqjD/DUF883 family membrane-anchored ribosome-binding protein